MGSPSLQAGETGFPETLTPGSAGHVQAGVLLAESSSGSRSPAGPDGVHGQPSLVPGTHKTGGSRA